MICSRRSCVLFLVFFVSHRHLVLARTPVLFIVQLPCVTFFACRCIFFAFFLLTALFHRCRPSHVAILGFLNPSGGGWKGSQGLLHATLGGGKWVDHPSKICFHSCLWSPPLFSRLSSSSEVSFWCFWGDFWCHLRYVFGIISVLFVPHFESAVRQPFSLSDRYCNQVGLSMCLSICMYVRVSVYLSFCPSVCDLSVCISICSLACPLVCPSVFRLSAYLCVRLSVCLLVCLSVWCENQARAKILVHI